MSNIKLFNNKQIVTVVNDVLLTNTYIVFCPESRRGFLVDTGSCADKIQRALDQNGVLAEAVLLTHGHYDHILSAKHFQDKGLKVYIHKDDGDKLYTHTNLGKYRGRPVQELHADIEFDIDVTCDIAGFEIKVLHTPGHSKGSACYLVNDSVLFSGDTLFENDIGRTDLYDGDYNALINAVKTKILTLDPTVIIYPGHDISTTVANESINFKRYD